MYRGNPSDRDLGPLSEDVLAALADATDEGEGLSRDEAIEVIEAASAADEERFWGEVGSETLQAEIEGILDGLVNRGYLYEVEGELRITDRDVLD